jgi:hypothetical protein
MIFCGAPFRFETPGHPSGTVLFSVVPLEQQFSPNFRPLKCSRKKSGLTRRPKCANLSAN